MLPWSLIALSMCVKLNHNEFSTRWQQCYKKCMQSIHLNDKKIWIFKHLPKIFTLKHLLVLNQIEKLKNKEMISVQPQGPKSREFE